MRRTGLKTNALQQRIARIASGFFKAEALLGGDVFDVERLGRQRDVPFFTKPAHKSGVLVRIVADSVIEVRGGYASAVFSAEQGGEEKQSGGVGPAGTGDDAARAGEVATEINGGEGLDAQTETRPFRRQVLQSLDRRLHRYTEMSSWRMKASRKSMMCARWSGVAYMVKP